MIRKIFKTEAPREENRLKFGWLSMWTLGAGALAGAGFNLAFGSAVWNVEGLLGGLVSALLINFIS